MWDLSEGFSEIDPPSQSWSERIGVFDLQLYV